jgi:transglutaminase-like putative cysteine protease
MHLTIDHRTRYTFSEPQMRVVQLLRMWPMDDDSQTVLDWSIDVDCDARLRDGRDGYGNHITMLYIDGPVSSVVLNVRGEVQTGERAALSGIPEALSPGFFLRDTMLTMGGSAILDFAQSVADAVLDPLERAKRLNTSLFERIEIVRERTPKTRTAEQTLIEGHGNVRDLTQLLLACARAMGIPARFVSGHFLDAARAGIHKSGHCWAELWLENAGWFGFDPSTGQQPDERYVRVAIGLDAGDATPLAGTRRGGGIEALDVDVRVALSGAGNQQ